MASKNSWVSLSDVETAFNKVLDANNGDLTKTNANMVAVALGKERANATIYKHYDELVMNKRLGGRTMAPPPTDEQRAAYDTFCLGIHNAAYGAAYQDAEQRVVIFRETTESARRDRGVVLDRIDEVEEERDQLKRDLASREQEIDQLMASGAEKDSHIRDLQARLDEKRTADQEMMTRVLAAIEANEKRQRSTPQSVDAMSMALTAAKNGRSEGEQPTQ